MSQNYEKLKGKLLELFMLDQPELDFGIYRIMNSKRTEITQFLEKDLLPQVKSAFAQYTSVDKGHLEFELAKAVEQAKQLGVDPETTQKVKDIRAKLAESVDLTALENEVYSDLYNFFRRYYKDGDFLSLRRYKEGVYAIPYEGEEVKLYWANHDQYYIKTSEYLRDYAFNLPNGKKVHFKLTEADIEKDNRKADAKKERLFVPAEENFIAEENGELIIRFLYIPCEKRTSQKDLIAKAMEKIFQSNGLDSWIASLSAKAPTEKNPNRTLLEKHLTDYTARNTFDYFIHKDLGGFLRRELDFYIKNEIMHLDDIESETAPKVEQVISKIKVIRQIAHKIIRFLEQLENFQKKLWLKKKFVVQTNYCVTLDRVPQELYPEIAANDAQRTEWVKLFAIDEIKAEKLGDVKYSNPLTLEFLKANPYLVLDTKFFSEEFKQKLLASFENIDEKMDGLLIHSENFQALGILEKGYKNKVDCVHIDPPYNTSTSGFLYKNNYQHSSWMTLMYDRLLLASKLLKDSGAFQCHIDENEYEALYYVFDLIALSDAGTIVWDKKNPMLGRKGVATQHEYIIWRGWCEGPLYLRNSNVQMVLSKVKDIIHKHNGVNEQSRKEFAQWMSSCDMLTGGEKAYRLIHDDGRVYRGVAMGAPEFRTNEKFHIPLIHPVTGKECPVPPNGWSRAPETLHKLIEAGEILFGQDETTQPQKIVFLTSDSKRQISSVIEDTSRGKQDMLGLGTEFPYCHPVSLYETLLGAGMTDNGIGLDFFAGSGTSGHAIINLNREDGGSRKYILVEIGEYFDSVTTPRIQKVIYSRDWDEGKPTNRDTGISHMFKYIRLESYEDCLNNLIMSRTKQQNDLLSSNKDFRESYMLGYMLDTEANGSASLLNINAFEDPFNYKLNIATGSVGETKPVTVDMVETFNFLLGLRVKHIDTIRGYRVIEGYNPNDEKVLVIWRNTKEKGNEDLEKFFIKQKYNTLDMEYDLIYVNGDNNLENLKKDEDTWKVRLIEEEFGRLMFDVQDVQ
jgi:adenine-specific DNA-methyltransferase